MDKTHKFETRRQNLASGSRTGSCAARESATRFACSKPGCGETFSTSRLLGGHEMRHEIDDEEMTEVFCAICEHSAKDQWSLARHAFGDTHYYVNEDVYNLIAQSRQIEEQEKEATTAFTRFYPFLRQPGRKELKRLNPNPPAPPSPYFDLAYPLIATLPSSNSDEGPKTPSDEPPPADVHDTLPGLDTQNPTPLPPLPSAEPRLKHVWDPDPALAAHLRDTGCNAGAGMCSARAAGEVFSDPDVVYRMLEELLEETAEKWDVEGW